MIQIQIIIILNVFNNKSFFNYFNCQVDIFGGTKSPPFNNFTKIMFFIMLCFWYVTLYFLFINQNSWLDINWNVQFLQTILFLFWSTSTVVGRQTNSLAVTLGEKFKWVVNNPQYYHMYNIYTILIIMCLISRLLPA